jgi:hypothetical protein
MKSKKTRSRSAAYLIGSIILLSLITIVGLLRIIPKLATKTTKQERITFYTNYNQLVGGACAYVEYSRDGERESNCVNGEGVEKAKLLIPAPNPNVAVPQIYKLRLIKIDADVHTETKSLSPTTPTPQNKDYKVIIIDNIYSAELAEVSPKPNVTQ